MADLCKWAPLACEIAKMKIFGLGPLEIPANIHSSFCPNLVYFSACVPRALQKGWSNDFNFDDFECPFTPINY